MLDFDLEYGHVAIVWPLRQRPLCKPDCLSYAGLEQTFGVRTEVDVCDRLAAELVWERTLTFLKARLA